MFFDIENLGAQDAAVGRRGPLRVALVRRRPPRTAVGCCRPPLAATNCHGPPGRPWATVGHHGVLLRAPLLAIIGFPAVGPPRTAEDCLAVGRRGG